MKNTVKKVTAALCCALLLCSVMAPTVFALDFFNNISDLLGDDIGQIIDGLLNNDQENDENGTSGNTGLNLSDIFSNPGGILDALRTRLADYDIDVSNSAIASALVSLLTNENALDMSALLDSNDLIPKLIAYFANEDDDITTEEPTTEAPTEETTTEEPTDPPTTAAPATTLPPVTYYYPATQATAPTTEAPTSTEPEYSYVEPSVQFTDELTTVPFTPVYDEDYSEPDEGVSAKMIVGIVILIFSAAAVVVVAVVLKKTKV